MKGDKFSFKKRVKSFGYAFNGVKILFQNEHNSWVHIAAAIVAITLGFILTISSLEWIAIVFAIGLVFTAELINTSLENVSDFISLEKNDSIKKIKDLAAASVLISSFTALSIGLIVFVPKIYLLCSTI